MRRFIVILVMMLCVSGTMFAGIPKVDFLKNGYLTLDDITVRLISHGWEDKSGIKKIDYNYKDGSIEVITEDGEWILKPTFRYSGILLYDAELVSDKKVELFKKDKKKDK